MLATAGVREIDGSLECDADVWSRSMLMSMKIRSVSPKCYRRVGVQWLEGAALGELQAVLDTPARPKNCDDLIVFLKTKFPSTVNLYTVGAEFRAFKQKNGEAVVDYNNRFKILQLRAPAIRFKYEEVFEYNQALLPPIRKHVREVLAGYCRNGKPITLALAQNAAIDGDNNQRLEKSYFANVLQETPSSAQKKRKGNSSSNTPGGVKRACYNCGQLGHVFGTMEQRVCNAPVTEKTKVYFETHKKGMPTHMAQVSQKPGAKLN